MTMIEFLIFLSMLMLMGLLIWVVWHLLPWIVGGLVVLALLDWMCGKPKGGGKE